MNHLVEVLEFGEPVVMGRNHQREWILGNRSISQDEKTLSGQIGWQREGRRSTDRYDPDTRTWGDYFEEEEESARAPFAFDATTRILAVLQHRSFSETTVPRVFEILLRQGEKEREWPSTEWSVEPILDERDFVTWLRDVDAVTKVSLVAKLPNPDGLDEFGAVWQEMEARKARLLKQEMEAANKEEGLVGLEEDERVRAHIAMGTSGFGYVTAKGNRRGKSVGYDQRSRVAKETTDPLPPSWSDVAQALVRIAQRRRRRGSDAQAPSSRG
jgi:hypothetical protein